MFNVQIHVVYDDKMFDVQIHDNKMFNVQIHDEMFNVQIHVVYDKMCRGSFSAATSESGIIQTTRVFKYRVIYSSFCLLKQSLSIASTRLKNCLPLPLYWARHWHGPKSHVNQTCVNHSISQTVEQTEHGNHSIHFRIILNHNSNVSLT